MKKIFAIMSIIISLIIFGGCNSTNNNMNNEQDNNTNQEQEEQLYISTLEGVWMSDKDEGRVGEHNKIVIEGTSIRVYYNVGMPAPYEYVLEWVGIYVPFDGEVVDERWIFMNDNFCDDLRLRYDNREFRYSNGTLTCVCFNPRWGDKEISFTKVSD